MFKHSWVVILSILLLAVAIDEIAANCVVRIKKDGPVALPVRQNGLEILHFPDKTHSLTFNTNQPVYIWCPGNDNVIAGVYTCFQGTLFQSGQHTVNFANIECEHGRSHNMHVNVIPNSPDCAAGYTKYVIGHQLQNPPQVLPVYDVCYNPSLPIVYSKHFLTRYILNALPYRKRSFFNIPNGIYRNQKLDNYYIYDIQQTKISTTIIIDESHFWDKGHLAPNADFTYKFQRYCTFHYNNIVPQWKVYNEKRWNDLEQNVRRYVSYMRRDANVFTGTFGIAETNLQMTVGSQQLPIPKWIWKYVHIPKNRLNNYIFLTINYPVEITTMEEICNDVQQPETVFGPNHWQPEYPNDSVVACPITSITAQELLNIIRTHRNNLGV